MRARRAAHLLLNGGLFPYDRLLSLFIGLLIFANVALFILSTEDDIRLRHESLLAGLEAASVAIFTVEYVLRVWVCVEKRRFRRLGPLKGRLRYMVTFMALVDLLAIAPFYVLLAVDKDAEIGFLSAIRIFRIVRLLKMEKWTRALSLLGDVFVNNHEILLTTLFLGVLRLLLTATLLYLVEGERFPSIVSALYQSTLMLTGQGIPDGELSIGGKLVVGFGAVFSIAVFALPAGLLSFGFEPIAERYQEQREQKKAESRARLLAAQEHGYLILDEEGEDEEGEEKKEAMVCPTCGK